MVVSYWLSFGEHKAFVLTPNLRSLFVTNLHSLLHSNLQPHSPTQLKPFPLNAVQNDLTPELGITGILIFT